MEKGEEVTPEERVEALRVKLDEEQASVQAQDEHLSGLTHPFDPRNPCDPTRVFLDIIYKRKILDHHAAHGEPPGWTYCMECGLQGPHNQLVRFPCWHVMDLLKMYGI